MMGTFADVAEILGSPGHGSPLLIEGVSSASAPRPRTLSFIRTWDESSGELMKAHPETGFLIPLDAPGETGANVLRCANPRLSYAIASRKLFAGVSEPGIHPAAIIHATAQIGQNVSVGPMAVISAGVSIGNDSRIGAHAVLESGVMVGHDVRIGSHTSIGHEGFGFEIDADGAPIRLLHVGGVLIGDHVEIGSHVTIAQGTIEPTVINDHVKIDDAVFIAHNVQVGQASYVIAGAAVSGSVVIGERVWISPEVAIINKVTIGNDALVGIGAVVVTNVDENTVVAGVPAKPRGQRHERD